MNQDFLKLNKNIIIGGIVAGILAAVTAHVFSDQESYVLTTYTVLAEYVGFFGVFFLLFYLDNKKNYKSRFWRKRQNSNKNSINQVRHIIWSRGDFLLVN